MGKVEIISASAGSGKTTRIARELREGIEQKRVRPEAVLATTFTNKAAAELKERVRSELFRAKQGDAALKLEGARIGTVNSVCGRLVGDFALELGLSPNLRVLDEDQAQVGVRKVLSRVVTDHEKELLQGLAFRIDGFPWQAEVGHLIAHARTNRLTSEDLARSADESVRTLLAHLPAPSKATAAQRDAELLKVLEATLPGFPSSERDNTRKAVANMQGALQELRHGPAKWKSWAKLIKLTPEVAYKELVQPVSAVAKEVDSHPLLRRDLEQAIRLVFGIAARTLEAWQQEKTQRGVLDFVDQEVLALRVLEHPEFAERLRPELDLVLVDEFQDTSPLQLQLFAKLASLAKRSVWVGDQKQAIFGFRGTDPALMDAAIDALLEGKQPDILARSYRSRPTLVKLTSELFAKGFEPHGLPPERVKLTPALSSEPKDLGAPVEWWSIEGRSKAEWAAGLAYGVRKLLKDPTATVRDRKTQEVRALERGDVAVLCRTNQLCQAVAEALAAHGIPATVYGTGLLRTPEARAALLGLRLFIDPRDRLAAAELALLLLHPGEPDTWLDLALKNEGEVPFPDAPFHAALASMRERFPMAGPLAALDAVIDALELRELLPRWGNAAARFANLDALRSHCVDAVNKALTEGGAATAAGLIAHLQLLEDEGLDEQARLPGDDAVVVSTWHRAKGLEWPVTVLSIVESDRELSMFGLTVQTRAAKFSLAKPLEGRWLRYWPNPFHPSQTTKLRQSVGAGPEATREEDRMHKQDLRLLYVGWTRARDRLVLATTSSRPAPLNLLPDVENPGDSGAQTWGGVTFELVHRATSKELPERAEPKPDALPLAAGPKQHARAWVSPSTLEATATRVELESLGERLALESADMNALGQAVHGFLAADRATFAAPERLALAERCLRNWQQEGVLPAANLVVASDRLHAWVRARWPNATWHRELPVSLRQDDGSMLRGTADLVLELETGFVLIDHKSFPGGEAQAREKAAGFKGQLDAYASALSAAWNKPLVGAFIHLPVLGQVAHVW